MASKFYYFGYGSNMLTKRIHIQNPSAERVGAGKLQDYRLDFHNFSKNWYGAPATIVPTPGSCVFGAIWQIDCRNMKDLDNQEGVADGIYIPITVPVIETSCNKTIECRAYFLANQPCNDFRCLKPEHIPCNRQPSKTYLKTLVKGAEETGIPTEYVNWLRSIKHNSKMVDTLEKRLELQNVKLKV